ncbi:MAG: hypothetical protein HYV97_00225 [Bdellovibrio sp.]|nr:hypothetical protein [Bdellovibrio sp.]
MRSNRKLNLLVILLGTSLLLSNCSWLSKRRSLFSSSGDETKTPMVPKAQYDELLQKYEELLRQSRGEQTISSEEAGVRTEKVDLVDDLKKAGAGPALDTTVSLENQTAVSNQEYSKDTVYDEIKKLEKAKNMLAQKQFDGSLKLLREIEQSKVNTLKVHAKFYIGELLFMQGEYDLAMQLFEEILQNYAFSGVVYKALGRLIACSEKLKLASKKDKYFSILHDFFEAEPGDGMQGGASAPAGV